MIHHREFFQDLGKRLGASPFGTVASYVAGYDAGTEHAALFGFDEWLAMRADKQAPWITLVTHIAFAGFEPPKPYSAAEDRLVVGKLFELLDAFFAEVGSLQSRRELLRQFTAWQAKHST
jgi:hypothetical protein